MSSYDDDDSDIVYYESSSDDGRRYSKAHSRYEPSRRSKNHSGPSRLPDRSIPRSHTHTDQTNSKSLTLRGDRSLSRTAGTGPGRFEGLHRRRTFEDEDTFYGHSKPYSSRGESSISCRHYSTTYSDDSRGKQPLSIHVRGDNNTLFQNNHYHFHPAPSSRGRGSSRRYDDDDAFVPSERGKAKTWTGRESDERKLGGRGSGIARPRLSIAAEDPPPAPPRVSRTKRLGDAAVGGLVSGAVDWAAERYFGS